MQRKYLSAAVLLLFSASAIAQAEQDFQKNRRQSFVGVKIVPSQEMSLANSAVKKQQLNENGYIESETENPKRLMSIKARVPPEVMTQANDPYNSYLRKNVDNIKLSFHYQPISRDNLLGFAPAGTTIKTGWTGIKEFFEDKDFGVCALTKYHLVNSKMGIKINADAVTYAVGSHPTTVEVEGSDKSGFMYTVSWVDGIFANDFECARNDFDKNQISRMISYANKIAYVR